jgi:hypothetical protein
LERGWGQGGEMNQALYAHMNNKRKMEKKKKTLHWRNITHTHYQISKVNINTEKSHGFYVTLMRMALNLMIFLPKTP